MRSVSVRRIGIDRARTEPAPHGSHWSLAAVTERYALIVVWAAMVAGFSIAEPNTFFTAANFQVIFGSQAVLLILTVGLMIPLIAGEFDLSVAALLGFANQLLAVLNVRAGIPIALAIVVVIITGLLVGAVNAFFVVRVGVPSIVTTLASGTLLTGLGQLVTHQDVISGVSSSFASVVNTSVLGLPLVFYYGLILCAAVWYCLRHTPVGRYLYFVGEGREVARLAGLDVGRFRTGALIVASLLSAVAGILLTGQASSATPDAGTTYLLPAFAGVFLGATTLVPGRFNVWGCFAAVYFLVTGFTGLQLAGLDTWVQNVFYGASLLAAVGLARLAARGRAEGAPGAM